MSATPQSLSTFHDALTDVTDERQLARDRAMATFNNQMEQARAALAATGLEQRVESPQGPSPL